ncbi:MAG: sulfide-dependent adenosine diphosphate thiazole synthase [Candidatus Omnitrophica bacterium]|nr:sulfide-dependent adenosine diphosphate thiazole synthase [Candidatus Omnitrophota bacterium]
MFSKISEAQISKTIVKEFCRWFEDYLVSEVVIIGAGPSGLMAGRDLAKEGVKVLIIESNNYIGGGFWIGGYFMNSLTFRSPAEKILDEIGIPYYQVDKGLFVADGPHACSKLIAATCEAGARILNLTKFDDVVYRNGRVEGVVVNWSPVSAMPRQITCVDPIAVESKIVIDATGHDAWVAKSLEKRGFLKLETFGPMDVNVSEGLVVEKTGEVFPGLIVCGMATASVYGIPRMGPTFAGMLFSGRKAAQDACKILGRQRAFTASSMIEVS